MQKLEFLKTCICFHKPDGFSDKNSGDINEYNF